MKQEKSPKNRNIWGILAALFAVAALACIILFIKSEIDSKKMADDMSSLAKVAPSGESGEASEPSESASSVEESSDEASQPEETEPPMDPFEKSVKLAEDAGVPIPDLEVDIQKLQETENPDIYAWIYIPGTKVNYPVLQHPTDDTYYLNYNIDGSKGLPGCIFSEKAYNGKNFSDHNTVLYGHNMKNGTMFGCLHKYEDVDFFDANRYIYVYTQEKLLVYKIFAAYNHKNEHLLYNHNFNNPNLVLLYFENVRLERNMNRIYDDSMEFSGEEYFITLSTCINGKSDYRFLVQGVLINEE